MGSSDGVIRVLITDDHPVMRDGLRAAIAQEADMEVVGEAADGAEAIERYRALQPDVTLIDLQMPNVDGLEAIQAIRADYPQAVMVVLTTFPGDARVTRAMKLGAISYLLKSACRDEILRALDSIQLTAKHKVSTPANWKPGEDVALTAAVSDQEANEKFGGFKAVLPYLRMVKAPKN